LDSTRHLAMLMHLQVSTQWAFHRLSNEVTFLLLYLTHRNLTHDRMFLVWKSLDYRNSQMTFRYALTRELAV
jgi:hypothetical protein